MDDGGGSGNVGGIGGIGAGGGKEKGKNVPNERKREAEARRKAQQDLPQAIGLPPFRVFKDGSYLVKDWSHSHSDLLKEIFNQKWDTCWALVLARILEFVYNKDRFTTDRKFLDIDSFIRQVKLTEDQLKAHKKLDLNAMAVGSLKKAMDHIFQRGIEKDFGRKGGRDVFTVKGIFREFEKATPQDIIRLLEKGPVGITVDVTMELRELKEGIYRVPKPQAGEPRHAFTIVAYGMTEEDEVFFDVQNTWGTDWGVNGHGRIMITDTTDDIFYLQEVVKENKKKKKK